MTLKRGKKVLIIYLFTFSIIILDLSFRISTCEFTHTYTLGIKKYVICELYFVGRQSSNKKV